MYRGTTAYPVFWVGGCLAIVLLLGTIVVGIINTVGISNIRSDLSSSSGTAGASASALAALDSRHAASAASLERVQALVAQMAAAPHGAGADTTALARIASSLSAELATARHETAALHLLTRQQHALLGKRRRPSHDDDDDSSSSDDDDDSGGVKPWPRPPVCKNGICRQMSVSGFGPAYGGESLVGKHVLVIGGSRGVGCGAVKAFLAAGATVLATSRFPDEYPLPVTRYKEAGDCGPMDPDRDDPVRCWPLCPNVAETPLDLGSRASIDNFFDTDPVLASWTKIDVLVLGGIPVNAIGEHNAGGGASEDLFIRYKVEILGRTQVAARAYSRMKHLDDARIINLASIAGALPLLSVQNYVQAKFATTATSLQWNVAEEYRRAIGLNDNNIQYINFEAFGVNSSIFHVVGNLINAGLEPFWAGGQLCAGELDGVFDSLVGVAFNDAITGGMTERRAGDAIVWMSTTRDPEWRYIVEAGERMCISQNPLEESEYGTEADFADLMYNHRNVKTATRAFAQTVAAAVYNNYIADQNNDDEAVVPAFYVCPTDMKYQLDVDNVPAGLTATPTKDNFCCEAPNPQWPQTVSGAFLADLCDDPCKATPAPLAAACAAIVAASASSPVTAMPSLTGVSSAGELPLINAHGGGV